MSLDDLDIGPLTWVKPEVDAALLAARAALADWNAEDTNPLRAAAAYLHQVYGALQIVDLQGVSQVTAETEHLLLDMAKQIDRPAPEGAAAALDAIDAIKAYLDGLIAGARQAELVLAAVHARVVAARGGEPPAPSELFYPALDARPPRRAAEPDANDPGLARAIHAARAAYQRGLLQVLRNQDAKAGLAVMEQAVRQVEALAPGAAQHGFWWSAAGLLEALRRDAVALDPWIKRLFGRMDLQMRRLMEGSRQLAERLLRDVLYYVAQDPAPSGRSADVNTLFELKRYFAKAEPAPNAEQAPFIANLRDSLADAKEHWIRYCGGRAESLEPFQHAAMQVFEAAVRLPNAAMKDLARIVQAVAKRMPGVADAGSGEQLQVELATALLLAENATEHYAALGDEFQKQAEAQAMRVQAALDPAFDQSRIPVVDMLDAYSRAAQEKLLLAQVTQEIQSNLRVVEDILDAFFRNANERDALPRVPSLLKQTLGAFSMLQLGVASDLVRETMTRIEHFNDPQAGLPRENLDWVAEALSTLGLYVDALRYGRDDTRPLARLLATPEAKPGAAEETVERQMRDEAERLAASLAAWQAGGRDDAGRDALKTAISQFARDADLVADNNLRAQAEDMLRALDAPPAAPPAPTPPPVTVADTPQPVAPPPVSAAPPQPAALSARQLAAASDEVIDQELLDTYIEEANEVLGNVVVQISRLHVSPYDTEAFTVVRRGFHTLKGSGRMVGLTDLAELAWEVEQTLNHWLRDERAPNAAMLAFLEDVSGAFHVWVGELQEQGIARVEGESLAKRARALRETPEPGAQTPKPEAGAQADSPPVAGEPSASDTPNEADAHVCIGDHCLPKALFDIFASEARQRLDDLASALAELRRQPRAATWESLMRAAHTLSGIARTTGFEPLASAAHAVEAWCNRCLDKTAVLPEAALAALEHTHARLAQAVQGILDGRYPDDLDDIETLLAGLDDVAPASTTPPEAEQTTPDEGENEDDDAQAQAALQAHTEAALDQALAEAMLEDAAAREVSEDTPPSSREQAAAAGDAITATTPPAPARIAAEDSGLRAARDELDEQLLPIFLDEAGELMPRIGEALRAWRASPADAAAAEALKRALHTLKGSARMAGAMVLGERVHALEARVIHQGDAPADDVFMDALEAEYDHLHDLLEHLRHPGAGAPNAGTANVADAPAPTAPPLEEAKPETPAPSGRAAADGEARLRQAMRLKADVLDTLLNEAGEVAIARARVENVLSGYRQTAQELAGNVSRLRSQLRELEIQAESQMKSRMSQMDEGDFDPLEFDRFTRLQELTRQLAESVNDVSAAQDNMLAGLNEADTALAHQSRMTRTLQQELMHMRMVPLNTLAERLYRIVRQSAKETGRRAQLEIIGGQTELDRAVLDKIVAPLEHLLRNAVAHGIETPEQRAQAGKPEYGEVELSARQEGNEIVLTLRDDGAGVDWAAVGARAAAEGLVASAEELSREAAESLLFRSGFSTAKTVTELAGRGIGLDVVKNEIASMGGRVRLESETGQGARFTIRLPVTLALTQVVLARGGDQTWALPANIVSVMREVSAEHLQGWLSQGYIDDQGDIFMLRGLAELVGLTPAASDARLHTVLFLKSGENRLALRIDALEGNFEAVVKPIGPQLARIAGISGATVLGDGRVALILNVFQLAERAAPRQTEVIDLTPQTLQPLVMVVDDSLTVRKITGRLLERRGYRVSTARDGVEALEKLELELPAVMLLDIEMPRMDGFEVTQRVRENPVTADLPIIMITSRTADKHREHALELGVSGYMGKPYQEDDLVAEIERLSKAAAPAH